MKKKILVKGPALSASGYGEQTRFALRALKSQEDQFDIFLINIPWGKTGWMLEETPEKIWFEQLMFKTHQYIQGGGKFDMSLQVTIPNEFEKIAPVNIGYTAGIETTKVSPQWIEKCKIMDKIVVVSSHSKNVFDNTKYIAQNQQTGQTFDFINTTPVEIVGFPIKNIATKEIDLQLVTDFNFLSVVQWSPRKNLEATINAFFKEFKDDNDVGLVLKINMTKNCTFDRMLCEKKLVDLKKQYQDAKCKLYLIHGNMTEEEVYSLYCNPKIKAIISTSHGEGFGLPLFEAASVGLPVIAPKWSGHVDFLMAPIKEDGKVKMRNHFTTIEYDLSQVSKDAVWDGVIQADSMWCYTREYSVRNCMRDMKKNHVAALSKAKKLQNYILEEFSEEKQIKKMKEIFQEYVETHDQMQEWLNAINQTNVI